MGDSETADRPGAAPETGGSYRFKPEETAGGGRYEIVALLERGSLGEIYRARSAEAKLEVNLRWLPGIPEEQVRALAGHSFPPSRHLVNVVDVRATDGGCLVATEPYPSTLRRALREGRIFEPETAIDRMVSILLALVALEERGVVPVVVSPESIALWGDGAALDEHYLPLLFPPEARPVPLDRAVCLAPDLDPKNPHPADALYGLGSTFYEMLRRQPLLSGGPFEIVAQAMQQKYRVDLPEPYAGFIRRLLAPTAGQRYGNADAALKDLEAISSPGRGPIPILPSPEPTAPAADGVRLQFVENNDKGYPVFLRLPEEVRMVLLPGGTFRMGTNAATERDNESPAVEVTVGPLLIDESPVTWKQLMSMLARAEKKHPLNEKRRLLLPRAHGGERSMNWRWSPDEAIEKKLDENQPAVMVTHNEASLLGKQLGLELPSEAEWEYAYRGGTTTEYWWGDVFDPEYAWCSESRSDGLQVVGQTPFNPFGLLDMAGNVSEFCRDFYLKNVHTRAAGTNASLKPVTADQLAAGITEKADSRSLRGGSWQSSSRTVRAAFRLAVDPDLPKTTAGFRFVIRSSSTPEWAKGAFERPGQNKKHPTTSDPSSVVLQAESAPPHKQNTA